VEYRVNGGWRFTVRMWPTSTWTAPPCYGWLFYHMGRKQVPVSYGSNRKSGGMLVLKNRQHEIYIDVSPWFCHQRLLDQHVQAGYQHASSPVTNFSLRHSRLQHDLHVAWMRHNCWKFTVFTSCAQLTLDLLAIAKFLVSIVRVHCEYVSWV